MSLPNLKDKIEGRLSEGFGEPGRSGQIPKEPVLEPEEKEETVEKVGTVPKRKLKGRIIRKVKSKNKK